MEHEITALQIIFVHWGFSSIAAWSLIFYYDLVVHFITKFIRVFLKLRPPLIVHFKIPCFHCFVIFYFLNKSNLWFYNCNAWSFVLTLNWIQVIFSDKNNYTDEVYYVIMRVFLARERVPSSCTSLARIRDNLRELGMKTSNFILIPSLFHSILNTTTNSCQPDIVPNSNLIPHRLSFILP